MCRASDDPVNHVISFRVNDAEKELLYAVASQSGVSISRLLRNSVHDLGAFWTRGSGRDEN